MKVKQEEGFKKIEITIESNEELCNFICAFNQSRRDFDESKRIAIKDGYNVNESNYDSFISSFTELIKFLK